MRRGGNPRNFPPFEAKIEGLTQEGHGVTRIDGKAVFVAGALPGETVIAKLTQRHRNYDEAETVEVLAPSSQRVTPRCEHFGVCGGCVLQHLDTTAQIEFKQSQLMENLRRIGGVTPARISPPLSADSWGYRRKARLGVKYVEKKARVLLGFRERRSHFLTDVRLCPVLHPDIGERLGTLSETLMRMEARALIPQIEVAIGDLGRVLSVRHLQPLCEGDQDLLREFGLTNGFSVLLQAGGPEHLVSITGPAVPLRYELPEFKLDFDFGVSSFTQVNHAINRKMVAQAIDWLSIKPEDEVLDLYCGLGNFSLALARRAGRVVGVEGEVSAIARAKQNAEKNAIHNVEFYTQNLAGDFRGASWTRRRYHKMLLDPPRTGALEALQALNQQRPSRILYVSCNPSTLARDAQFLVNDMGYQLMEAGAMDMFPHTAHVESMALFVR